MKLVKDEMDGVVTLHGESKIFIRKPRKRNIWEIWVYKEEQY
jgi:hypothetical protein